jgi:hypothetical protein
MTSKRWSISALAVEMGMDRRTVAHRLRDVPPAGTEKGHPVWFLPDALRALGRGSSPAPAPAAPEWCRIVDQVQPPHFRGLVAGALGCIYKIGGIAYSAAIESGLTEEQAGTLASGVTLALIVHAENELVAGGVEPFASTPRGEVAWIHSDYLSWRPAPGTDAAHAADASPAGVQA